MTPFWAYYAVVVVLCAVMMRLIWRQGHVNRAWKQYEHAEFTEHHDYGSCGAPEPRHIGKPYRRHQEWLVNKWPKFISVEMALFEAEQRRPRAMRRDGNTVRFWVENGWAVYRVLDHDENLGATLCERVESVWEAVQ